MISLKPLAAVSKPPERVPAPAKQQGPVNCPSCDFTSESHQDFCIRCGFALARRGQLLSGARGALGWLLRRSFAGMMTGLFGWFFVAAAGRATGASMGQLGHLLLTGLIGGYFLGTVEGMVEDSTVKTLRGGLFGILGGLAGGVLGNILLKDTSSGMSAVLVAWAVTGAAVGASSVWMERQIARISIGAMAGLLGGALGGWLGYQIYASLLDMVRNDGWLVQRSIEGITGAVLGACLWAVLGIAEKVWIFRRRIALNISYKECDRCQHANVLKAWYCASCGALLQVAAPADKLYIPKRQALARVIAAIHFLAQLATTSSVLTAVVTAAILGMVNPFLGLFGLLAVSLAGYLVNTLFNALADCLLPLMDSPSIPRPATTR